MERHERAGAETKPIDAARAALRPRVWALSLAAWALVAMLVTATVVHTQAHTEDFVGILAGAFPAWVAYVLLTPPVLALDAWLTGKSRAAWIHALSLVMGCAIFIALHHFVSIVVGSTVVMPWSWIVYAVLVVLARSRRRRHELRARELQTESLRRQLAEARVAALQARLQPHFLFNTLHAVSATLDDDPDRARRMLVRLSDLLRSVLRLSTPEVSLAADLRLLEPYVELQSIRFGERVAVVIDVPDELRQRSVPALLLQPLVENALTHGVGPRAEGGVIRVAARDDNGALVVSVTDNGVGVSHDTMQEGIGIGGLRERVATLYGAGARVTLTAAEPSGTRVEVVIPRRSS